MPVHWFVSAAGSVSNHNCTTHNELNELHITTSDRLFYPSIILQQKEPSFWVFCGLMKVLCSCFYT